MRQRISYFNQDSHARDNQLLDCRPHKRTPPPHVCPPRPGSPAHALLAHVLPTRVTRLRALPADDQHLFGGSAEEDVARQPCRRV